MGLIVRDNGYFYIKIDRKGEKPIRITTKTKDKDLAQEMLNTVLLSIMENKIPTLVQKNNNTAAYQLTPSVAFSNIQIEPIYQEYLETDSMKGFSDNTISFKKTLLKKLLQKNIKFFSDFNQNNINKFIQYLKETYDSNDTINKYVAKLKAFLHYSIKKGHFNKDGYEMLDFISLPGKIRKTIFTDSDFNLIIDYLEGKEIILAKENFPELSIKIPNIDLDYAMYLKTLYYTSSRAWEIIPLKPNNFDFDNCCVTIYQSKLQHHEEPIKYTYFPEFFATELKSYIEERNIESDSFIFNGASQPNQNYYGAKFRKLKIKLGLNPEYKLTAMRHTAVTDALNATSDLKFASDQAGHKNILKTEKHYANRNSEHNKALAQKIKKK